MHVCSKQRRQRRERLSGLPDQSHHNPNQAFQSPNTVCESCLQDSMPLQFHPQSPHTGTRTAPVLLEETNGLEEISSQPQVSSRNSPSHDCCLWTCILDNFIRKVHIHSHTQYIPTHRGGTVNHQSSSCAKSNQNTSPAAADFQTNPTHPSIMSRQADERQPSAQQHSCIRPRSP